MNQISSMTGSGHAQLSFDDLEICVDLRSVNNRFFEFYLRSDDPNLQSLTSSLREMANKELFRGKTECSICVTCNDKNNFNVDQNLLCALKNTLTKSMIFLEKICSESLPVLMF